MQVMTVFPLVPKERLIMVLILVLLMVLGGGGLWPASVQPQTSLGQGSILGFPPPYPLNLQASPLQPLWSG